MIAGYETKAQVLAMLEALKRERATAGWTRANVAHNPQHLRSIEAQEALFKAELERMEAEGDGDEPVTTNPALGTTAYWGIPGVDRGRIV
jgi:hypothetical protein